MSDNSGGILGGILGPGYDLAEIPFLDLLPKIDDEYRRFAINTKAPNALRLLVLNLLREKHPPPKASRAKPSTQDRADANFQAVLSAMLKPALSGKSPKGINAAVKDVADRSRGQIKAKTLGPAFHKHRLKPLLEKLGPEGLRLHLNQALYPLDYASTRFTSVKIITDAIGQRTLSQKASDQLMAALLQTLGNVPVLKATGRLKSPIFSGLALAVQHRLRERGAFADFEMLSSQSIEFRRVVADGAAAHPSGIAIIEGSAHYSGHAEKFAQAFVDMGLERPPVLRWSSGKDYQPVSLVFLKGRTPPVLLQFDGPVQPAATEPAFGILGQVVR